MRAQRVQAHLHFCAQLELMAIAIIYFLEPVPESSVLVGGSQGLAPLLHVRSGTVYLNLIESRWAPNDSSLLRQPEWLIPAASQSWADDFWMCKGEHEWFLIRREVMTGAWYYQSWISVLVCSPAKDGISKLDIGWGQSEDESEPAPLLGLRRQYGTAFTNFCNNENPTSPHSEEPERFWKKISPWVSFFDGLWPSLPPG